MQRIFHTPEGVRDIYNGECSQKHHLQTEIRKVFDSYGYEEIETPSFEYFEVFSREVGTIPSKDLYKFFDREGNTLVLRPDFTPSVSRACATYFNPEHQVITLSYTGNTFINNSSYQGRLKETTQMGVERIGDDSAEADAELLAMTVECLLKAGLKEFQVSVGHVDFIQSLMEATGLEEEKKEELHSLITNRNYFGVEEILDTYRVKGSIKEAFRILPELTGGPEIMEKAAQAAPSVNARLAIVRLLKIYKLLTLYGVEQHITFDLSMSGSYGYYTGIIFRAYTYGTGDAIVRGGRYDHLLEKFGKSTPSIGFAIIVDELMSALNRQKIAVETREIHLIVYTEDTEKWALSLAKNFRAKGKCVGMYKRETGEQKEHFMQYAKRQNVVSMLYLRDDLKIEMINLKTGDEKTVDAARKPD